MKKNIHPKYGKTKIVANNGVHFEVCSCLCILENSQYHLAADAFTHPAWTRSSSSMKLSSSDHRMAKFKGIDEI